MKIAETHIPDAHARFADLLKLAEERFATGDLAATVGLGQIAARYVFPGKGLFASPRLERLLLEVGKQIPSEPGPAANQRNGGPRNILHILTHARPIGGDSRFAWRWIQRDPGNRHSVAITTQADVSNLYDIPKDLKDAAVSTGGFVRALEAPPSKPLEQARELRRLCQEADVVALHLYPYDVIPVLALAAGCDSAKTLFINHADHNFWVGGSVAHSIVHLRTQSPEFLRRRRGLDPDQSSILPIPLVPSPRKMSRAEAKRALGYDPDVVLLLTIATPFKYSSPGRTSFLELVTPVLQKCPAATLVAVGPKDEGSWASARAETNGRIVALGTRWDNDLLYAAADVYLDSVPFSSSTSLLEAGSLGVPLLGCKAPDRELDLLGPGAPGLEGTMEMGVDAESYQSLLVRLINDTEFRRQSGERVQEKIISLHSGTEWHRLLQGAYAKARQTSERKCLIDANDRFENGDLNVALVRLYDNVPAEVRFSAQRLIRQIVGRLPYRSRLPITWRIHRMGLGLCWLNLLPPPLDNMVYAVGRAVRKAVQRLRAKR